MSGLSSEAKYVQLGLPTLRSICPSKVRQLKKNGCIALTQPHVDRLRSNFIRWYSVAPGKLWNCQNSLRVEFKMADDAHIFNIRTPIFMEHLKLETSHLVCASTTRSNFDGRQKTRSKGTWPSLGNLDLNWRTLVNISRTAKATWFKFITQIDCKEWKISSTKVGQKGT